MSAILIGDLPRVPLTEEQRRHNSSNRRRAQRAQREYDQLHEALRDHIAKQYRVTFESDEGGYHIETDQHVGELDFDRFTAQDWTTFRLESAIVRNLLDRTVIRWPEVEPKK